MKRPVFILVLLVLALLAVPAARAGERIVVVGTGPVSGAYYPAGGALCRTVNKNRRSGGVRCLVESTAGSESNLRRLRAGELDFAFLQSDWQYYAGRDGSDQAVPRDTTAADQEVELRAVVSLQAQPFTLVAGPDSGITALRDLKGKRVDLGPPDSAQRKTGMVLMQALGWDEEDFAEAARIGPGGQVEALCEGAIDAFLLSVSHPNAVVGAAAQRCGARLVPIQGPAVDVLLAAWPFYAPAVIPSGLYQGNTVPVPTFGLRATLVTTLRTPEDTVYRVVRALFEGLYEFRDQHPALAALQPQEMISQANSLALHEGALRYYRETGLK